MGNPDQLTFHVGHLNLGNNFHSGHFETALQHSPTLDELTDYVGELDCEQGDITLKADLNFGYTYEETYCAYELYDLLIKINQNYE